MWQASTDRESDGGFVLGESKVPANPDRAERSTIFENRMREKYPPPRPIPRREGGGQAGSHFNMRNSFNYKILPGSCCSPRIKIQFSS